MARFHHPALVSFGSFLLALPACSSSRSDEAAKPDVPAYCRDPGYPAPPRARKMGGSIEFVVAERTRDAGDARGPGGPTYLTTGFNLDRTCTGALEGQSCERPSWATAVVDDGPRGQDNAFGALVYSADPTGRATKDGAQAAENSGQLATLVRVHDYDGLPDDDQVTVAVYNATMQDDPAAPPPSWDGTDEWRILSPWLVSPADAGAVPEPGDAPAFVDSSAYVSGGILVAHFDRLLLGGLEGMFEAGSAVLSARVSHDGAWTLDDGLLGGRVALTEALRLYGNVFPRADGELACAAPVNETYLGLKIGLCSFADIAATEQAPRAAPCDAISYGASFTTVAARIGGRVVVASTPAAACPPGEGTDSCDTIQ